MMCNEWMPLETYNAQPHKELHNRHHGHKAKSTFLAKGVVIDLTDQ